MSRSHYQRDLSRRGKAPIPYVIFPSVEAGMLHLAYPIKNIYHGDYAQWHSKTNSIAQQAYRKGMIGVKTPITNQLMEEIKK